MMRSLLSGVSGLKVHQTKMDVIGNNIANVNTVAFKSNTVTFGEVFYQTTQGASGSNEETGKGGQNAMQIGLGTSVGAITSKIETEGSTQRTDNPFDLKINGQSFFVVGDTTGRYFTRAGNFVKDDSGKLVTSSGLSVMGWLADEDGTIIKDNVQPLYVEGEKYKYTTPVATTTNTVSGNINKEDESFVRGESIPINLKFYDSLGYSYLATVNITQDATDPNSYTLSAGSIMSDGKVLDGYSFTIDNTVLTFDESTGLSSLSNFTIEVTTPDGATPIAPITVDTTQLKSMGDETSVKVAYGDISGKGAGKAVGTMTSVSIQADGKICAYYSNGDINTLGQIVVTTFSNPAGLEKMGDNLYKSTVNSGDFDGVGEDISATGGSMSSGVLEMSNVDLSSEFADMITTQRGFQANSRIITVSDTMLEELINLKR